MNLYICYLNRVIAIFMENMIPKEIALKLCEEIRKENARKRFSFGKLQCRFCYKFNKDNPELSSRCIFGNEQNRGCWQVNKRYDALYTKRS